MDIDDVNTKDNTLSARLKRARAKAGVSQKELADAVGATQGMISKIERGDQDRTTYVSEIAHYLGVDESWLATGKGKMGRSTPQDDFEINAPYEGFKPIETFEHPGDLAKEKYVMVPHLDARFSAGNGVVNHRSDINSKPHKAFQAEWIRSLNATPKDLVMFEVTGNSMSPRISDGDSVLVDTGNTTPEDGNVFILRVADEARLKRIQVMINGDLLLISDSDDFQNEVIKGADIADIEILGRVVWVGGAI